MTFSIASLVIVKIAFRFDEQIDVQWSEVGRKRHCLSNIFASYNMTKQWNENQFFFLLH